MQAITASAHANGMKLLCNSLDADAAVIWSVLWQGRMRANKAIYDHYRGLGRPVVIIDIGSLHRGKTWKIAVNHITAQGHYGHLDDLDWDRPKKLGISLGYQPLNSSILLALQNDRSLQVQDIGNMTQWLKSWLQILAAQTDRPLVVRPHPRCRLDLSWIRHRATILDPRPMANTYDSFDLDCGYHAVINHNSGPGIQAALCGSRPLVSESSLAWPVSVNMADLERPYDQDRERWLVQICHTEYTVEEINQGTWLKRLATWL